MNWYDSLFFIATAVQLLGVITIVRNYRYALAKIDRPMRPYHPKTMLICPCKGIDEDFHKNIESLYRLDYAHYALWFVVEDALDPAYTELQAIRDTMQATSKAVDVQVEIAGHGQSCSQKIHNLLHCINRIDKDTEVLAFADSDICVRHDWLIRLIWPLRKPRIGVSSGYRWFVPSQNNLASLALSVMNAKVAQLLGNTRFGLAWGGSMAIRTDVFRRLKIDQIWRTALSDDLSLSYAIQKEKLKVAFVPACLVASHQSTTWKNLFEFSRRQFLITRVGAPMTWLLGLASSLLSVAGFGYATARCCYRQPGSYGLAIHMLAIAFIVCQLFQAILRQGLIARLLPHEAGRLRRARWADLGGFWLWSIFMLVSILLSAFGRTICWRGKRYRLVSPTKTVVLNSGQ